MRSVGIDYIIVREKEGYAIFRELNPESLQGRDPSPIISVEPPRERWLYESLREDQLFYDRCRLDPEFLNNGQK